MEIILLAIACVVGCVVVLVILPILVKILEFGLEGAAAIVSGIASFACGRLFYGLVVIIAIAVIIGFFAGIFVSQ